MSEPSTIESEVPGEQKLREGGSSGDDEDSTIKTSDKAQSSLQEAGTSEITTADDFTLEPVITVTKQESTFTKGEMKLQKVTVTEDISRTSEGTKTSGTVNRWLTYEVHTKIPSPTNAAASKRDDTPIATHTTEKENTEIKRSKTKIPMSRFRQAVDQVKREQKEIRKTEATHEGTGTRRKSSIPRPKDNKISHQLATKDVKIPKEDECSSVADEDEFDKIFREINEKSSPREVSISNEECVSQVESSFDEIIHAYEEDVHEKVQTIGADRVRQSRIPMLKRKSEHDIERPRNREKYTIKKSLSFDMDSDDISTTQTEYTTETVTSEEFEGYVETDTESVIFRSDTSYSNEYSMKKRQGITCDENVYDRILITDETFEDAEERYRLSKYKQGETDIHTIETVPIIHEPEDTVKAVDITESYDDLNLSSETQLTKISSEQVRFDKQIVSKIYKIDFTENTFELADSETTDISNEHTQNVMKEETSNETIISSTSKDSSNSKFLDRRKTEDAVGDFKVSRYKTTSNETTRDTDKQNITKHSIEATEFVEIPTVEKEAKEQYKELKKNNTDSIRKDSSMEIIDTEQNTISSVTTSNINEIREAAVNVEGFTIRESTVQINDTERTATFLSSKYNKNTNDTASNIINQTKEDEQSNDIITKYSTEEVKDSSDITHHLITEESLTQIREVGNVSASITTKEMNKKTEIMENKESESITKDVRKEDKDTRNSVSVEVKKVGNINELIKKYSTQNVEDSIQNTSPLISKRNLREIRKTGNISANLFKEVVKKETVYTANEESIAEDVTKEDKNIEKSASISVTNVSNTNDFVTKSSTHKIEDSTDKTNHLVTEQSVTQIRETGNVSASITTKEINKKTGIMENKESESITRDIRKEDKDIGNSASVEVKKVGSINELIKKYSRQNFEDSIGNTTPLISKHNFREIRKTGNVSANLIKEEVKKETVYTANRESITEEVTKEDENVERPASISVTNVENTNEFVTKSSTHKIEDSTDKTNRLLSEQSLRQIREIDNVSAIITTKEFKKENEYVTNKKSGSITEGIIKEDKNIEKSASASVRNVNNTNVLDTKYSTNIENSTDNITHLISKYNEREIEEFSTISASLITKEVNNETVYIANKESESITKEIKKEAIDAGTSASVLNRNLNKEFKKDTKNNETNLIMIQNDKEINHESNHASDLYIKYKTKDVMDTSKTDLTDFTEAVNETKITSIDHLDNTEVNENKIVKNLSKFDQQTSSQTATLKFSDNSYDITKLSSSPVLDKSPKTDVNGNKTDHDEETYKIYSDVFSKLSTANKVSTKFEARTGEVSQKMEEFSTNTSTGRSKNISLPEFGTDSEENTPILKGKVSRIINKISSIDIPKTEEKERVQDVPKKKSILSKIALFERDELYEKIPKPKPPQPESKPLRGLAALRQTSSELRKPKIVDEIYKNYSERSAVKRGTKLLSEKGEEEITIEIKNIRNEAVNRFDTAFNKKLFENKTVKDELGDSPNAEYFYSQKEKIGVKVKEEEKDQEEITIPIKNVTNEPNLPLSDSTFKSKVYEYKTFKNNTLIRAKSEGYYSQAEARTEEKRIGESTSFSSSTSDLLDIRSTNESQTIENRQLNADEKVSTIHYESSFKINSSANSRSNNITHEVSSDFKRSVSFPTNVVEEKLPTEKKNTLTVSEGRKENEIDKYKKSRDTDVTGHEESKEDTNDKMAKRIRRRDPILERALSVVEDDLGDVMKGKVRGIISRINSMERIELSRKKNEGKRRPWGSVSERIALFEGKASSAKAEKNSEGRSWRNKTVEAAPKVMDHETCMKRIAELKEAKKMYGITNSSYMELRDGSKMPVIALGTALLDKRLVRPVVEAAIDLGYRAIDTAFIYGNEKEIGEGINAKIEDGTVKREDLFIISKLWSTFHRRDLVETACRSSLEAMGLEYFDLYLIHNPMSLKEGGDPIPKIANVLQFSEHDFMDAWYGMETLVTKGLVKSAGLSNFNSEQVHRVAEKGKLKPVVNQVECHPYLSQDRLAGFCDAYGMKLICFGALGSKGTPKAFKSALSPAIEDPLVQVMAAGLGVSAAQLLLAFQIKKGRAVVAKASSAAHLYENLLAQRLPLATGQLTALSTLDRHKRTYTFEGMGETHKNYPFNIAF